MKKICPICDLPVNKYNYCTRCRRRVRHPVMGNADYYLNERPPVLTENQEKPGPAAAGPARPQTAGKKGLACAAGSVVLAMLTVLNVLPFTVHTISGISETVLSYDNSGYKEFDEEEVSRAGERCNGNSHFPVDGRGLAVSMSRYVKDFPHGYGADVEDTYSDNYGFEDETGLTTCYETTKSIYLVEAEEAASEEDYTYQYVDLNYDTATGELHYYASSLKNNQASLDYLEEFLKLTESMAGLSEEESSVSQIMEQAETGILQEEGAYILEGLFDISIYRNEDEMTVFVYYNDPQLAEKQEV